MEHKTDLLKKVFTCLLLMLISIYFSGCTIEKAGNTEKETTLEDVEEEEQEDVEIDTDTDGLPDVEEQKLGTSIDKLDSDGDRLTDFEEVKKWKTNPMEPDTDGDGYKDGEEITAGYDPLGPGQLDINGNGIGDADEKRSGGNPEISNN